jgi:two-component system sensor histidine kinase BaeS
MRSLNTRLVIAFLVVSLLGTVLAALYIWRETTSEFGRFVVAQSRTSIVDRLAAAYQASRGWKGVVASVAFRPGPADTPPGATPGVAVGPNMGVEGLLPIPPEHVIVADANGVIVMGGRGYRVGEAVPAAEYAEGVPITVEDQEVGRLLLGYTPSTVYRPFDRFMFRFYLALGLGGIGGTAVALSVGVLLARSLTSPLRDLTRAAQAMSRGDLEQRIAVRSDDELGALARSFNQLSEDLVHARAQRRQMTADIAHELRTPLSLILGHSEALADGVLEPKQESFDVIYDEARRLTRLVDDLHTLSLSDAGQLVIWREPTSPEELLRAAATAHAADAEARGVALDLTMDADLPKVDVDRDRIIQVLHNLLSNALRYTPSGGRIALSAQRVGGMVRFGVQDSGPGIAADDLDSVFERFYRADPSRGRDGGGSGLGLAIARSIIEQHGGRIWAESVPGAGATLRMDLPVAGAT